MAKISYKDQIKNQELGAFKDSKTPLIHMRVNDSTYYCNQAVYTTKKKMSSDWNKVTCQNCLIIGGKMNRFKEAMKERETIRRKEEK